MSLSDVEKSAISESWKLISDDLKGHGVNMLVQYLKDYPKHRVFFQDYAGMNEDELRGNHQFRTHANLIMYSLSSIVENLDDPGCLKDLLRRHVINHQTRRIEIDQYRDMFTTIIKIMTLGLRTKCTPLAQASWKKAFDVIGSTIEREAAALNSNIR